MKKGSVWKFLIYFIVYSIFGFLIETIYAIFTKGMLESRKSFLYGPFCIVYGIAAVCLIFTLKRYKNSKIKLFLYGLIIGSLVEYFSSYIAELFLHIKWWDYSDAFLNIHGRTCLYYGILWGILTILLIQYINPLLDKYIEKIISKSSEKFIKISILGITLFMIIDGVITCYALNNFLIRVSNEYSINIKGIEKEENLDLRKMFSNEKMMMTYPNMIIVNEEDEIVYVGAILSDIKNYYYKFKE